MQENDNALERRVEELLGYLDESPNERSVLPFTVSYLVGRVREVSYESSYDTNLRKLTTDS